MTNFKKQIFAATAAGTVLLQAVLPMAVFAEDGINLEVSGNGAFSDSTIKAAVSNTTKVTQTNTANVVNNVDAKADSGNNDATGNTGGDVLIKTGDAASNVDILNDLNKNVAQVACCEPADTTVKIDGNGYKSTNDVGLSQTSANTLVQTNVAGVTNYVDSKANSGRNDAKWNTGGDVTIMTGDAKASADVATQANSNFGMIGGPGAGNDGEVTLWITGNGAFSDNDIKLALAKTNTIVQTNTAKVLNDVDAYANSGKNDAKGNTGGDVAILTGKADASVEVDNHVNFNSANIDCGCVTDITAKIAGNGKESYNDINASIASVLTAAQVNAADLRNDVDAKAKSGYNDAKWNTGPVVDDPVVIMTGDAASNTEVENSSNTNVYGGGVFPFPPLPEFNWDLDFSWWGWFGWMNS